jgi:hypothetical protein
VSHVLRPISTTIARSFKHAEMGDLRRGRVSDWGGKIAAWQADEVAALSPITGD